MFLEWGHWKCLFLIKYESDNIVKRKSKDPLEYIKDTCLNESLDDRMAFHNETVCM